MTSRHAPPVFLIRYCNASPSLFDAHLADEMFSYLQFSFYWKTILNSEWIIYPRWNLDEGLWFHSLVSLGCSAARARSTLPKYSPTLRHMLFEAVPVGHIRSPHTAMTIMQSLFSIVMICQSSIGLHARRVCLAIPHLGTQRSHWRAQLVEL